VLQSKSIAPFATRADCTRANRQSLTTFAVRARRLHLDISGKPGKLDCFNFHAALSSLRRSAFRAELRPAHLNFVN
jgi:hypothetical protein